MSSKTENHRKVLTLTQFSLLFAIELIVCFTPLGTLPIGSISATLSHIPVIITAAILGVKAGALMGFIFGACSFIVFSFVSPGPFSFVFTPFYSAGEFHGNIASLLICFVPRILIGVITALFIKLFENKIKSKAVTYTVAGLLGSLTNTLLVLGGIALFFGRQYASLNGLDSTKALFIFLGTTLVTNGIMEAVLGALSASAIALPVKTAVFKGRKKIG